MPPIEIHVSDVLNFKRCRRRWGFSSPLMSHLEPKRPNTTLWLGTGVHYGLNEYYRGNVKNPADAFTSWADTAIKQIRNRVELTQEQFDKFLATRELGEGMLQHYTRWAPEQDKPYTGLAEEYTFAVPLPGFPPQSVVLCGRWDRIVRDRNDLFWIMEHKTTQRFDTERLILDEQVGVYIYAAHKALGLDLQGVLYNMLRKKAPTVPEPLKSGGLTKRANIDTTEEVYRDAISMQGLDSEDYEDILGQLRAKGNTFFYREFVYRSEAEIKLLMANIAAVVVEMLDSKVVLYPNPNTLNCLGCMFQGPCIAMADGSDWKFILQQEFHTRVTEETQAEVEDPWG